MAWRRYPLVEHCEGHVVGKMKWLPAPNRFLHFCPDFRVVLKLRPCRSRHREFLFCANKAAPLPTLEKSGDVARRTTNASPRRETSLRIHSVALRGGFARRISGLPARTGAMLHRDLADVSRHPINQAVSIRIRAAVFRNFVDQKTVHHLEARKIKILRFMEH